MWVDFHLTFLGTARTLGREGRKMAKREIKIKEYKDAKEFDKDAPEDGE